MRKIGVLGGMGPEATILLQSRLLNEVEANDDSDHMPLLIDMNPQVPSRLEWILEKKGTDPGPVLAQMAIGLQQAGAEVLAMPCNTAHHFASSIEGAVAVPFLNMPKLAAAEVVDLVGEGCTVGVLASPATQITHLFDNVFEDFGCEVVFPEKQKTMLDALKKIKATGADSEVIATLQHESDKLIKRGVHCIVIGCSEFSLLSGSIQSKVPLIDTLNVLVNHLVVFSGGQRKKVNR